VLVCGKTRLSHSPPLGSGVRAFLLIDSTVASQHDQMVIGRVASNVAVQFPPMPGILHRRYVPTHSRATSCPTPGRVHGGNRLGPHGARIGYLAGQFHVVPLVIPSCCVLVWWLAIPATSLYVLLFLVRDELTHNTLLLVFLSLSFFILLCMLASRYEYMDTAGSEEII
jgi:hypothetical protein